MQITQETLQIRIVTGKDAEKMAGFETETFPKTFVIARIAAEQNEQIIRKYKKKEAIMRLRAII